MSTEKPTSLRQAREETIDALCQGFARESISLGELERRLETARSARSRDELAALLRDLPGTPAPARPASTASRATGTEPAKRPERRPAPSPDDAEAGVRSSGHLAVAVMGGTRRAGRWAPPQEMAAVALMGGVELDFREAVLGPGVTEINCFAFWGSVEITVPPGVEVESRGFALLGGFEQDGESDTAPDPEAPRIVVNGLALMGAVEIKVVERGRKLGKNR
ncbi:MAG: DUF1707 domain-containing protein [Longimicrobiales bacterium]|nr:DUF1707 domain-containing protein [Longimicrobiales bacterium]